MQLKEPYLNSDTLTEIVSKNKANIEDISQNILTPTQADQVYAKKAFVYDKGETYSADEIDGKLVTKADQSQLTQKANQTQVDGIATEVSAIKNAKNIFDVLVANQTPTTNTSSLRIYKVPFSTLGFTGSTSTEISNFADFIVNNLKQVKGELTGLLNTTLVDLDTSDLRIYRTQASAPWKQAEIQVRTNGQVVAIEERVYTDTQTTPTQPFLVVESRPIQNGQWATTDPKLVQLVFNASIIANGVSKKDITSTWTTRNWNSDVDHLKTIELIYNLTSSQQYKVNLNLIFSDNIYNVDRPRIENSYTIYVASSKTTTKFQYILDILSSSFTWIRTDSKYDPITKTYEVIESIETPTIFKVSIFE